ncbi:MAG TPA: response regulator transcription factor [Pyrinomonadaceae bacterium]|nr:response regulator transcription factor [Pyrinomonadaceae bacterium]
MADVIRILIAENHKTVRTGIKLLVDSQPDMTVVGEADDGAAAMEMVDDLRPDIVIMDITMPNVNGLQATTAIKKADPSVKVLALTRHSHDGYLRELIKAGVNGYVLKQSAPNDLIDAIRTVSSGKTYLDPTLMDTVMEGFTGHREVPREEPTSDLTERETEVLRLIALGYSNKEIAATLEISVKTVETHKANAMRRLGIGSRIEIVRYAMLHGWLQPGN